MGMLQVCKQMKQVWELFRPQLEERLVYAVRKCAYLEDDGHLIVALVEDGRLRVFG